MAHEVEDKRIEDIIREGRLDEVGTADYRRFPHVVAKLLHELLKEKQ